MVSKSDFFIAVYTNSVKDYCDKEFFSNLNKIKVESPYVVDNSEGVEYTDALKKLAPWAHIKHLTVFDEPKISRFQRNVSESVNYLRELFLATSKPYFLILESDVIPPKDLLDRLIKDINYLDNIQPGTIITERSTTYLGPWGILGALYYEGFHNYGLKGLQKTEHVLSGCTVYKREVVEKFPFRYDPETLGAFPDALISFDAKAEYSLWNDHDIQCKHLHTKHGTRISRPL